MKVGDSVKFAIDAWERGELEPAMLHACLAVDGTASKLLPELGNKARFTKFLRDEYGVLGPMGAPRIDLAGSPLPVTVRNPTGPSGRPDMADVLYAVHRCSQAHGDEMPGGFELIEDVRNSSFVTRMSFENGKARLSDRIIFGMLWAVVLASVNSDQLVPNPYRLSYGQHSWLINSLWGHRADLPQILALEPPGAFVKLDFGDWVPPASMP